VLFILRLSRGGAPRGGARSQLRSLLLLLLLPLLVCCGCLLPFSAAPRPYDERAGGRASERRGTTTATAPSNRGKEPDDKPDL